MKLARRHLSYANVISTICLFVLLGGGAYAAAIKIPAKSVGTAQLKAGAVTGVKIKDGTITGAKVDSRTLGIVPAAQSADRATSAASADRATSALNAEKASFATKADEAVNAELLDGNSAGDFVSGSQVGYIDRALTACTFGFPCIEDVLTIAGVSVRATCEYNGGIGALILRVTGANQTAYGYATRGTEARSGRFANDGNIVATQSTGTEVAATGTIVARTPARIVTLSFDASSQVSGGAASCTVYATALAV